jgi:PAS domain S-box-containing protein/putative nucleotidyltransferase with HDIG domain
MNRIEILYTLPYVGSFLLSVGVLFYAWRHRRARSVSAYTWYALGQTLWILGFLFELISPDLSNKLFWDGFQWLSTLFILIAFPVFAVQYVEIKLSHPTRAFWLSLAVPTIFALLLMTDSLHHWIYPNPSLKPATPFPELNYSYTFVSYAYGIYALLVVFWAMSLLTRHFFQVHDLYRAQTGVIILGFLIPIAGYILALANVQFAPQRDGEPFTIALGNLIVAWGLIRLRIFEIIPIARDRVIENMLDLVVVVDAKGQVVDANPAALFALNKKSDQVIGKPAEDVFAQWPELLERFNEIGNFSTEVPLEAFSRTFYYEIESTILEDKQHRYKGRVFVSRDISERIELQTGLQKLNEELEQRVRERTDELRESAERYRAVVENQTEFIVRWKLDGQRTFVNDAYCRYYGLTPEQALGTNFLHLVDERDRPAVEAKITRLMSGTVENETDVHRVIKPDGSIGWQEWVEQVIRDEVGAVVEIQSVGRDITDRKQAEENLAIAYDTTLEGWARALEMRDQETKNHSERVVSLTLVLARAMGIAGDDLLQIRRGAILHDIGKMAIPDEILSKRGPLTIGERKIVEQHPTRGYELLSRIPFLEKALVIPYCHHEHWDGSGYPRGLKGKQIPLAARIFSVIDVWDAVQSERPYNHTWPKEKAVQYLKDQSGKYFDPECVSVFLGLVEQGKI